MSPWKNDPESRRRSDATYRDPEYTRNRQVILRNADGRCQQCGRPGHRLQVDHVVPVSQGGGHQLGNLQVLCTGCHRKKTAAEGGGYRNRSRHDPPAQPRTKW